MAKFIVIRKLSIDEALEIMPKIEQWFKDNPKRKICQTDSFKIRRGFTATDVLKHSSIIA